MFKTIEAVLGNGMIACRWYGMEFSQADQFTRLDKTFLYCIYRDGNGRCQLQRIIGFEEVDPDTHEPKIVYALEPLFRVVESSLPRRVGRVLPKRLLWEQESARPAGLRKRLEKGSYQDQLDPQRNEDNFLLSKLAELEEALSHHKLEVGRELLYPRFFLSARGVERLYLRSSGETRERISGLPGYNPEHTLAENFRRLHQQLAVDAGRDKDGKPRSAYPYDLLYGKGVRVVDRDLNNTWILVALFRARVKTAWLDIDLRRGEKRETGMVVEGADGG